MSKIIASECELKLIKARLLLPIILQLIEKDRSKMSTLDLKMNKIYQEFYQRLIDEVNKDLVAVRKGLREKGIKILEENINKEGLRAEYLCRGYQDTFAMIPDFVKAETETLYRKYFNLQ